MKRRAFIQLAGGGVVAAAVPGLSGCSTAIPPEAVAAWQGPPPGAEVREWILAHAILAPHSHNLQSWLVDLRTPEQIMLYCDPQRLLPQTDPQSRQIMMSHGTFLELLDMAAREKGLRADIELFPEGAFAADRIDRRPVARVRLVADANVKRDPLFAQVFRRRTNREPYADQSLPLEATAGIAQAVKDYPVRVGFVGKDQPEPLARHRAIAAEAWRIELTTPRTLLESYKVLRVGPDEIATHRDGISLMAPLPRLLAALGLFDRSKAPAADDAAITGQIRDFNAKLQATPGFFWMVTEGNDRKTQVRAGQAYVRAQLAATALGLSMQPVSQALQEFPEVAGPYADIHRLLDAPQPKFTVQMWARLGYAPTIGPAPRRGLKAHILSA